MKEKYESGPKATQVAFIKNFCAGAAAADKLLRNFRIRGLNLGFAGGLVDAGR